MTTITSYLSHRRVNGGSSEFAQKLIDDSPADIEVQVDHVDADYFRPIDEFISKIKTSPNVIFLLNEDFFKSPWCMSELHEFMQNRRCSFYGCYIACDDWLPSPLGDFFLELEKCLIVFWQAQKDASDDQEYKNRAQQIIDSLPAMINSLSKLNLLSNSAVEKCFQELWPLVRLRNKRAQESFKAQSYFVLMKSVKAEAESILKDCKPLCKALANQLGEAEGDNCAEQVLARLWHPENSLAGALSQIYLATNRLIERGKDKAKLRPHVLGLIKIALLGTLDQSQRTQALNGEYGITDNDFICLNNESDFVVEALFSSAHFSMSLPKLEINSGKMRIDQSRTFPVDRVERGYEATDALNQQLHLIWKYTFPYASPDPGENLDRPEKLRELNDELAFNFEAGLARYFLIPEVRQDNPICDATIIEALKNRLPFLFVIRTSAVDFVNVLSSDFSETNIESQLQKFAALLK